VRCQKALGKLASYQGNYFAACQWAEQALAGAEALGDLSLQ